MKLIKIWSSFTWGHWVASIQRTAGRRGGRERFPQERTALEMSRGWFLSATPTHSLMPWSVFEGGNVCRCSTRVGRALFWPQFVRMKKTEKVDGEHKGHCGGECELWCFKLVHSTPIQVSRWINLPWSGLDDSGAARCDVILLPMMAN